VSDDRARVHGALADALAETDLQALIVDRAGRISTSAAAIHRMGGVITVDSRVGEGTVFTVRLTLKTPATSARAKAA